MGICDFIMWYVRGILRELRKRKFRPFIRYWTDSKFRTDIRKLRKLLSRGRMPVRERWMEVGRIHFSHEINYPEWVDHLTIELLNGIKHPLIKVTWDGTKYIIVDGNHRLAAIKRVMKPWHVIRVRELVGLPVPASELPPISELLRDEPWKR